MWAPILWVGRWQEPILGYVSKIDEEIILSVVKSYSR